MQTTFLNRNCLARHQRQCGTLKLQRALALQNYQEALRNDPEPFGEASANDPPLQPLHSVEVEPAADVEGQELVQDRANELDDEVIDLGAVCT